MPSSKATLLPSRVPFAEYERHRLCSAPLHQDLCSEKDLQLPEDKVAEVTETWWAT